MPAPSIRVLLPLAIAALLMSGCDSDGGGGGDRSSTTIEVVASTNVYADIASAIGGDTVHATSFISSPAQDPHSYEASSRNVLTVSKADLVIENGGGYDDFMDSLLDSAGGGPEVLNVVESSGLPEPASGSFNEHVWYNLPVIKKTADAIAVDLSRIDAAHAATYRANADAFKAQLQELIDREDSLRRQLAGKGVAITEPVPGYMLDALGLDNQTPPAFSEAVEEGEEVAVSVLAQTLDLFTNHEVEALVYNEQTTGPVTEEVLQAAQDAGIPVVPVTETLPEGDDYVSWMTANLAHIAAALGS